MVVHPFEAAVGGDQLRRRLLADPGYAGQVVAGVAAQARVVEVLRGRDAQAPLGDARLVVEDVVGDAALVVENLDVRIEHELVRVAVAGDDHDVESLDRGLRGEGGDDVVGFDAGDLELR